MKNSAKKIRKHEEGFTLLELMVSFLIIGIVILIIAGAMRLGLNIVDKGEAKIGSLERTRTSLRIINSQIQSQFPLAFEEDGEKKFYFKGDSRSMQLATNYSIWGGRRGYALVSYKVETNESGREMLSASENIVGMDNIKETTLFNSLDKIYFEYSFKDPTEEEGEWIDEWTDNFNIPEKIRLHLEAEGKDFSVIIPVRATGASTK